MILQWEQLSVSYEYCHHAHDHPHSLLVLPTPDLVVDDVIVAHSRLIHHHVRTDPLGLIPAHVLKEQVRVVVCVASACTVTPCTPH